MNTLPKEIEDIIIDYKHQMEHKESFQSTLDIINSIHYSVNVYDGFGLIVSSRSYTGSIIEDSVEYYNVGEYQDLHIENHCPNRGGSTIHTTVIYDEMYGVFFEELPVQYD